MVDIRNDVGMPTTISGLLGGIINAQDAVGRYAAGQLKSLARNIGRFHTAATIAIGSVDVVDASINGTWNDVAIQSWGLFGSVVGGLGFGALGAVGGSAVLGPGLGTAAGLWGGATFGALATETALETVVRTYLERPASINYPGGVEDQAYRELNGGQMRPTLGPPSLPPGGGGIEEQLHRETGGQHFGTRSNQVPSSPLGMDYPSASPNFGNGQTYGPSNQAPAGPQFSGQGNSYARPSPNTLGGRTSAPAANPHAPDAPSFQPPASPFGMDYPPAQPNFAPSITIPPSPFALDFPLSAPIAPPIQPFLDTYGYKHGLFAGHKPNAPRPSPRPMTPVRQLYPSLPAIGPVPTARPNRIQDFFNAIFGGSGRSNRGDGSPQGGGRRGMDAGEIDSQKDPRAGYSDHNNANNPIGDPGRGSGSSGKNPVLFDLNGDGFAITERDDSTHYFNLGGDGYDHRTAWAGVGDYLLSDGPPFVTVHLVAVDLTLRPFRRAKAFLTLVAAVRQWAASEQASPVFFHVMTGTRLAATDRLMKAAGAQCVGGSYVG